MMYSDEAGHLCPAFSGPEQKCPEVPRISWDFCPGDFLPRGLALLTHLHADDDSCWVTHPAPHGANTPTPLGLHLPDPGRRDGLGDFPGSFTAPKLWLVYVYRNMMKARDATNATTTNATTHRNRYHHQPPQPTTAMPIPPPAPRTPLSPSLPPSFSLSLPEVCPPAQS